ncbi:MAG: thiamine pyrophosphate-dependent enzyme [Tepidibacter sp.]|jgi:indolepyruvate ferredoxin oxidoreductase alpha subunit|uniref:thiamine pyrophosphate-dependent enzyme n=1 Tax=Tepidibacter sp. TaxID=2529387 RepID=UPI0025DF45D9|nr:thiamine pyrophosphate-dependent enzyme [Tepidibacter sp.]MCT4507510.1 thiamine pyrophosphate-dependent enzyme [Tepidibacter sp.]
MNEKVVLTGNQAIARGFYEAGGLVASSYPGSPTVGIIENIKNYKEVYSEFSTNEKVALEVAMGASFGGVRSLCSMKHVGVNIAADPLMTFTQTTINGGFILITGDDPGMHSSQNEQDNRVFGKFANMAILDPSDSQEAKDFTKIGLELSENYNIPFMLRITSRLCHNRSIVNLGEREEIDNKSFEKDAYKYCMLPPYTDKAQYFMKERLQKLEDLAYNTDLNKLEEKEGTDTIIITSGLVYQHLKEIDLNASIYKLGMVYPISIKKIKELSQKYKNIIILEEMMPFIENELKINGIDCKGKQYFSFTGEIQIEDVEKGLAKAGLIEKRKFNEQQRLEVPSRSPQFCSGCPHRPIYDILKKAKVNVIGDIGCYSMGVLYPFEVHDINISMGSGVSILKGMRKAWDLSGNKKPLVAMIGDGTFFHSGVNGFINLMHKLDENANMTIIVLDNKTTAMTGGQPNASSDNEMDISIEELLKTIGFERIKVLNQYNYKKAKDVIDEEIKHEGLSIIVATGPCALQYRMRHPHFYVDPDICISCRNCIKTNCPPLLMKKYEGHEKLKSSIDPDMCVGCSICAQVCPVNAIKSSRTDNDLKNKE